ncbi:NAD-dependent epimerase/dehydratase family protein [Oceanobacillus rekensis]|uniref:polysaccharide biosynthesis C-terminal domain-containing protein n=1 Tax=Oceanobacillus rekensis TaxID=937927 RepID=UPI000B45160B|nr:NAD-dependent epimerase/dehydratase family protein [Oceanobacillus rekensis]
MVKVLITGATGFIGKNLAERLSREEGLTIMTYSSRDSLSLLYQYLNDSDIIYHLAGVNRPLDDEEFVRTNLGLTELIVNYLKKVNKNPKIVFSSSTQAELNTPYGISKKKAEDILKRYSVETGAEVYIYRLPNVFGKWCKPNYNSVAATFCYNISHGIDISIHDSNKSIELVYIDDVVNSFTDCIYKRTKEGQYDCSISQNFKITLGELANKLYEIRDIRKTLMLPNLSDKLTRFLYSTYMSYFDKNNFSYELPTYDDERGTLFELIKSHEMGQIFVSKSRKGVIRGNHYHNTKIEKFLVIKGEANIKFRNIDSDEVITYFVTDKKIEVVDIPPGYIHSIENLSNEEMIVLFWANEVFNPNKPDTIPSNVQP